MAEEKEMSADETRREMRKLYDATNAASEAGRVRRHDAGVAKDAEEKSRRETSRDVAASGESAATSEPGQ